MSKALLLGGSAETSGAPSDRQEIANKDTSCSNCSKSTEEPFRALGLRASGLRVAVFVGL